MFSVLLPHNWIKPSQCHCTLHHVRTFAKPIVWILASFVEETRILLFRLTSSLLAVWGGCLANRMFGPVIATSPTRVNLYPKYQPLSAFSFSLIQTLDTGSPDPRSSERRWLSSLSGTLSACPTCFLHTKFPSPKSQGYSQTLTPSIPRILEGADQSFFLSN